MFSKTICRWAAKSRSGQQQLKDATHTGRPASTTLSFHMVHIPMPYFLSNIYNYTQSDSFKYGVSIARRLAIAKTRGKCYCQTSGNSTKSGKMLLPDVSFLR